MFEKSLVDLIKGLRNHKGNEAEYIQNALRECRTEIRSQDMDVKATALLKLVYLEMFGYDMTWAAFNALEVMSSAKHIQKRVGYLAAVQTIRPDTDVLMLATNLLKKDLSSPSIPIMTLPLITLPHIVTSSLALSILTDLLPRLSHSQPAIRKKTIVTLYRLALVYPETLRVAWPKIKDRLMDEQESSSVTAAAVNVVCELGWRRPHDFLPLAPRLFDLLIEGGNNWMAIKIIKLFAVLTPLEPRLVKKLVRPLTNLIQSTTAMSLLYECISGIIQGGILDNAESGLEGDEVANLCISKLRGMIVLEGDPNLKYVSLLAFNKIVTSHPALVSMQQDVVMGCLDDPDISIRLQALELVSGMVSSENLQPIVDQLLKQLSSAKNASSDPEVLNAPVTAIEPKGETDGMDLEQKLIPDKRDSEPPPLPAEYRREVLSRILDMASQKTYANLTDFEWYVEVLVRLVRLLPPEVEEQADQQTSAPTSISRNSIGKRIGAQLLDIAVRVKELRSESTKAAEKLILIANRDTLFPQTRGDGRDVLLYASWVVGEFAAHLNSPSEALSSLIHESSLSLPSRTLSSYLQAIPKVFAHISTQASVRWGPAQRTSLSLLLARMVDFLEKLIMHPSLEVQERSVEFLELLRISSEALSSQPLDGTDAPLLLTSALPNLFTGQDLGPVAPGAQKKVPQPSELELDTPINTNLAAILQASQTADAEDPQYDEFRAFYHEREVIASISIPTSRAVEPEEDFEPTSYQAPDSPRTRARLKAERRARNKDDPFYIANEGTSSGRTSPFHEILSRSNGDELDVDSIPIIDLKIDNVTPDGSTTLTEMRKQKKKKTVKRFHVAADETVGSNEVSSGADSQPRSLNTENEFLSMRPMRPSKNLLSVDSSGLESFPLEGGDEHGRQLDIERREAEEAEMAAAMKEVERLRLEMQRAAEMTQTAEGVDAEGTVVKKKKRRKVMPVVDESLTGTATSEVVGDQAVKKKKKKKRVDQPTEVQSEV